MTHRAALSWLVLACGVLFGGCSALAPRSDASRFYFLTPLVQQGDDDAGKHAPLAVGLADIHFPPYLERPELATRVAANELLFSHIARWAEPLAPGFTQVLAVDLNALLGAGAVVRSPWYSTQGLDCILAIEVDHFEPDTSGDTSSASGVPRDAVLVARWTIRDPLGKKVLLSGTSLHRRPLVEASPESPPAPHQPHAAVVVAALSRLIEDFSREMAATLRRAVAAPPLAGR
jgi:uncharacterized lipoprotein YmbA